MRLFAASGAEDASARGINLQNEILAAKLGAKIGEVEESMTAATPDAIPEAYENQFLVSRLWKGLKGEALAVRHSLLPLPKHKFSIFAQGRTGSALLTDTLDTHSRIRCEGELLRQPRLFPVLFIENKARASGAEYFGFHVNAISFRNGNGSGV
jgi:hypothetical protein